MTQVLNKMNSRKALLALAITILALATQIAFAQGVFYVEEEKDGRIYVFNNMKAYQQWKDGGELGVSITRPGEGPNGETMVFDTDEAINLYNFKHGKPGEVIIRPEAPKPVMKFSWKDGKTTFDTDNSELNLSTMVQVRFTENDPEIGDSKGSFRIRRIETKLDGWIYNKNLQYELNVDFAKSSSMLNDANLNYDFFGTKSLMLKVGQFKVPFGREELDSSSSLNFVDRSIVSSEFFKGRDIGLQVWGRALSNQIEWRAGIFNGAGISAVTANDNTHYQTNARVTWQPFIASGDVGYKEADFESKDHPLVAISVDYENNDLHGATTGNDVARELMGGDVVFKFKGIYALGEYVTRDNDPETGVDSTSEGQVLQLGYLFPNKHFELAGRWANYDPNTDVDNNDRTETGVATSWYFNKHAYKVQGDYRQIKDDVKKVTDNEYRVQLQFLF
jgi:hypothetical protein